MQGDKGGRFSGTGGFYNCRFTRLLRKTSVKFDNKNMASDFIRKGERVGVENLPN